MTDNIIRKRLVFSGIVQGVGFRWRARRAAEVYGVTGWVRNDWSGTVTMELQGTRQQIEDVISAIERSAYIRIDSIESHSLPPEKDESGFASADERW